MTPGETQGPDQDKLKAYEASFGLPPEDIGAELKRPAGIVAPGGEESETMAVPQEGVVPTEPSRETTSQLSRAAGVFGRMPEKNPTHEATHVVRKRQRPSGKIEILPDEPPKHTKSHPPIRTRPISEKNLPDVLSAEDKAAEEEFLKQEEDKRKNRERQKAAEARLKAKEDAEKAKIKAELKKAGEKNTAKLKKMELEEKKKTARQTIKQTPKEIFPIEQKKKAERLKVVEGFQDLGPQRLATVERLKDWREPTPEMQGGYRGTEYQARTPAEIQPFPRDSSKKNTIKPKGGIFGRIGNWFKEQIGIEIR